MKGVTHYQLEMLQHIAAAPASEPLDFDQLLEKLSWSPSKESAQFTIRAVVAKGLMAKGELQLRRGRKRVTYLITAAGREALDPRLASAPAPTPGPEPEVSTPTPAASAPKASEQPLAVVVPAVSVKAEQFLVDPGLALESDLEAILEIIEP